MTLNEALWDLVNTCGWWFWAPFVLYGVYGLNKMYRLAPAETTLARWIRVLLTLAFLSMIFTPIFNGLGPYAFHLVTLAVCLWLKSTYAACLAAGKIKPATSPTIVGRTVERMVDKK